MILNVKSTLIATFIFANTMAMPASQAYADALTTCDLRGAENNQKLESVMSGSWKMTWLRGVTQTKLIDLPMETMPPEMTVEIGFSDGIFSMKNDRFKRRFDMTWDHEDTANFEVPDVHNPAYKGFLDTEKTAVLFGCEIAKTPFMHGLSISISKSAKKGPVTQLYLWMPADDTLYGMSVATIRTTTSRMMFSLDRK